MMDDKRLAEIERRASQATEGPWDVDGMDSGHSRYEMNVWVATGDGDVICDMDGLSRSHNETAALDDGYKDAWFIAHARTDVPDLLAEVKRLRAELQRHTEVSRVELIINSQREKVIYGASEVMTALQDDRRTLKVFLKHE